MNINLDLIFPPIIAGLLTTMIFSSNIIMMETTNENRLTYELQNTANNALLILQEEMRGLDKILDISSDSTSLYFKTVKNDTVHIYQNDRNLMIKRNQAGSPVTTNTVALRLSKITFWQRSPYLLNIKTITESTPEQEAGKQNHRYKAVAERKVYLKNLQIQTGT